MVNLCPECIAAGRTECLFVEQQLDIIDSLGTDPDIEQVRDALILKAELRIRARERMCRSVNVDLPFPGQNRV